MEVEDWMEECGDRLEGYEWELQMERVARQEGKKWREPELCLLNAGCGAI